MRGWLVLLYLTALALSAAAEGTDDLVRLRFRTNPPGAQVLLKTPARPQAEPLPVHDGVYTLSRRALVRGEGDFSSQSTLIFRLPGCREEQRPGLSWDSFQPPNVAGPDAEGVYTYPADAAIELSTQTPWWWVRYHPLTSLGVLMVTGLLVGYEVRRRGRLRQRERRLVEAEQRVKPDHRAHTLVGQVVGGYLVTERLGAGGMATVYKGVPDHNRSEAEAVAIKVIKSDVDDAEFQARFRREILVTKQLRHPALVLVMDFGEADGQPYLVLEFVDGAPLQVPSEGMPFDQVLELLGPVFDGLNYAHSQGVVHRDLKPENLMQTRSGRLKIMDFGLARSLEVRTVTVSGQAMGTPAYMAPEQITAGRTDPRTDQYALGVILYELLTGQRPFQAQEPMALLMMHLSAKPEPLHLIKPGLSPATSRIIARMLAKAPEDRFENLSAARRALEQASRGEADWILAEPEPSPSEPPLRRAPTPNRPQTPLEFDAGATVVGVPASAASDPGATVVGVPASAASHPTASSPLTQAQAPPPSPVDDAGSDTIGFRAP